MKTSYYAKYKGENAVSIALGTPKWFTGKTYKKLAPLPWFFNLYKQSGDEQFFTETYYNEVLSKLDAKQVYEELGADAVLLCWEKTGEFCHRRLVAEWLERELGIIVDEL